MTNKRKSPLDCIDRSKIIYPRPTPKEVDKLGHLIKELFPKRGRSRDSK